MSDQKLIVIIDDKDHALKQTIFEFPGVSKSDVAFRHFDTLRAFREARLGKVYLVLLDFFLSRDRDYGTSIIPELECDHLICFSSEKQASDHMYRRALEAGKGRIRNAYSVQKLKESYENAELRRILEVIFAAPAEQGGAAPARPGRDRASTTRSGDRPGESGVST